MQISSESVKVGHPDIVADMIAANIIATILDREHKQGMDINTMPHCGIEVSAAEHPKLAAYLAGILARPSFAPMVLQEKAMLGA